MWLLVVLIIVLLFCIGEVTSGHASILTWLILLSVAGLFSWAIIKAVIKSIEERRIKREANQLEELKRTDPEQYRQKWIAAHPAEYHAELRAQKYNEWLNRNFSISKSMTNPHWTVAIDLQNKVLVINRKVLPFGALINVELITQESHVSTETSQKDGGVGRAVVGGAIAGGAGAVVGAITAKQSSYTNTTVTIRANGVTIYTSDISEPTITIYGEEDFCREVYATVLAIIAKNHESKYTV
jgi:hypothetical protein